MYEELIKRLRYKAGWDETGVFNEAADAIEELNKPMVISVDHQLSKEEIERLRRSIADALIMVIPNSENANTPQWISVTERLPKDKEMVLCFTPVDGFMFVGFHYSYKWGSNTVSKWRIITAMRSTKDITKKVTHWMPLPQMPKEEAYRDFKPITNYTRLVAKSPKELVEWINSVESDARYYGPKGKDVWLKWLQEVDE